MEKKDFPRVTLVFEDGKWVGANKMTLAASSYLCAAAWQKKASAPTDLYEGNSEQYFGGIPPPGIMLNARNFSATYYTSREVCCTFLCPEWVFKFPLITLTSADAYSHWLHLCHVSPEWVFKCLFKLDACIDAYSHWLHLYDLSPEWIFKWVLKLNAWTDA